MPAATMGPPNSLSSGPLVLYQASSGMFSVGSISNLRSNSAKLLDPRLALCPFQHILLLRTPHQPSPDPRAGERTPLPAGESLCHVQYHSRLTSNPLPRRKLILQLTNNHGFSEHLLWTLHCGRTHRGSRGFRQITPKLLSSS